MFFDKVEYQNKFRRLKEMILMPKRHRGPIIVEVGAHYGEDSVRLSQTWPTAEVHAFEPDPRNWEMIKKYLPEDKTKNITFYNLAISDKKGKAVLFQSHDPSPLTIQSLAKYNWIPKEVHKEKHLHRSGSSSLQASMENLIGAVQVDVTTLDNWLTFAGTTIDLLWIDVQGAEKKVLAGAKTVLKGTQYIWIEYGENGIYEGAMSFKETQDELAKYNFTVMHWEGEKQGDILARRTT